MSAAQGDPSFSIVVPAYNEQDVLPEFHRRLVAVLDSLGARCEIVYVNDGSRDRTLDVIGALRAADPRIAIVDLSRNFGKEIALTAGLEHAKGDAVILIDADLQDPPELIPRLIAEWRAGYDVVYAQRVARGPESWLKRTSARGFYRIVRRLSRIEIPSDSGDFRLLSRRALLALLQLREQHRLMKGLYAWIGFPQKAVAYDRETRFAGATKWSYWRLWNLALDGITAFTIAPLKVATYAGLAVALVAFAYAAWVIAKTLLFGDPVPGYPSMMVVILLLGGAQLMAIGVIGEYLGRTFDEAKGRPLYFAKEVRPSDLPGGPAQIGARGSAGV